MSSSDSEAGLSSTSLIWGDTATTRGTLNCSSRRLVSYRHTQSLDIHTLMSVDFYLLCSVLFLAVLDPKVGHTVYVLSPFISVLCHSDWLFHGESCPRLDVVHSLVSRLSWDIFWMTWSWSCGLVSRSWSWHQFTVWLKQLSQIVYIYSD